jgi:demethylmenaquinone methyltransferase/2-methoxy-6-polyprenyl-1,4-benzoquinol methylase
MAGVSGPVPGAPERNAVRAMFDRIAPRYDLLNRLLSAGIDRRWRRRCIEELALDVPSRVLDVCTGTADLLMEFLRRDEGHQGVGVDLSAEMLFRGQDKLDDAEMDERGWLGSADAQHLPFPDDMFDGVTVGFGIRNVADPRAALDEMRRVLRPGARLVILEFAMPRGLLGSAYRFYFDRVLPRVGGFISGDDSAYRYLPESVARFPAPREFMQMMQDVGFGHVRCLKLTAGIACLYRGERRL